MTIGTDFQNLYLHNIIFLHLPALINQSTNQQERLDVLCNAWEIMCIHWYLQDLKVNGILCMVHKVKIPLTSIILSGISKLGQLKPKVSNGVIWSHFVAHHLWMFANPSQQQSIPVIVERQVKERVPAISTQAM